MGLLLELFYVCVYVSAWVYVHHVHAVPEEARRERASDALELELQRAVSHGVDSRNRTQGLCKSNHLSAPGLKLFFF